MNPDVSPQPNETAESTNQSSVPTPAAPVAAPESVDNTLILNILSYLGPLVLITFVVGKDKPDVRFHLKQGLVLFGIELVIYVAGGFFVVMTMGLFAPVLMLINVACLALTVVGIYHVMQKQEKPLPFIGFLANKIPL